jgi:hypothetical protein
MSGHTYIKIFLNRINELNYIQLIFKKLRVGGEEKEVQVKKKGKRRRRRNAERGGKTRINWD